VGKDVMGRLMIEASGMGRNEYGVGENGGGRYEKMDIDVQEKELEKDSVREKEIGVDEAKEEEKVIVDSERNEALEGRRAGDAVFKAIFGDDDSDDE